MIEIFSLALLLGIKHSVDADHLIAVSTTFSHSTSIKKSATFSLYWAAGHMVTAILITFLLFTFKNEVLSFFLEKMQLLAGIMLILIGIIGIYRSRIFHGHTHSHAGEIHTHWHMHFHSQEKDHAHRHIFGIGIVQGLASNDELLLILTASLGVATLLELMVGVAAFTLGVVIGMIGFGALFTFPLLKMHRERVMPFIHFGVGSISIIYGAYMLVPFIGA